MTADNPLRALRAPRTEPGRKLLALWLAGRTHPPSVQRLRDFTELVLAIEDETDAALREQLAAARAALTAIETVIVFDAALEGLPHTSSETYALDMARAALAALTDPAPPPSAEGKP